MDADILLWAHRHASPVLDAVFAFSWLLGAAGLWVPGVLLAARWCFEHGLRRESAAWVVVGLVVAVVPEALKALVARPRPTLWPWLIPTTGYSFPSGHAVAGAAFYPFLGWLVLRDRGLGWLGYLLGLLVGVFIGVGRLYVGVHWPTDVLAGWALGILLSLAAVGVLARTRPPSAAPQ